MAKSSKGVDIQFASIVELARCVECLEKIADPSAPVRVKSKNVKYKNDIFGHMPVCPVLVPCVSRLPPGSPVSFYRYCTTYDEVPGVFACSPRRVGRVRSRSRPSAAPRKVQRRRRRCRCNAPI